MNGRSNATMTDADEPPSGAVWRAHPLLKVLVE